MPDFPVSAAPAFHPSDAPHCDFLITAKLPPAARRRMVALGAHVETHGDSEIYTWGFRLDAPVFLGVGVVDGRFITGPAEIEVPDAATSTGTCCILSRDGDGVSVRPDLQGLYALYAGAGFITNRLHLAALLTGRMDATSTVAPFFNNDLIFWDQATTWDSCVENVVLLAPFKAFRFSRGQVLAHDIAEFDFATVLEPAEYQALISQGAAEICANVEAVLNAGHLVRCDITGGQDSRILLGAIVALGRIRDVSFNTSETRNEAGKADLAIGSGLVKEFGGSYEFQPNAIGYQPFGLAEAWEIRRSKLFGCYHFVRPTLLAPGRYLHASPVVRIGGACGEIYRDAFPGITGGFDKDDPADVELATRFFEKLGGNVVDAGTAAALARDNAISLCDLPGVTLQDKKSSHHLMFRSRFHFSNRLLYPNNHLSFGPLFSPSLLRAVRGLPPAERRSGRAMFDITRTLCERLAWFPFARPVDRNDRQSPYHKPSRFDGAVLDLPDGLALLEAARAKSRAAPRHRFPVSRLQPAEKESFFRGVSASAMEILRAGPDQFRFLGGPGMARLLDQRFAGNEVGRWRMASKLQQVVDMVNIYAGQGALR